MDILSYLLGKKSSGDGGSSVLSEYFTTEITENTGSNPITIIKKYPDIVVANNVTDLSYAFRNSPFASLPKLIFDNNVTDTRNMYAGCLGIIELDCSNMDTSNVTNMYQMFFASNASPNLSLTKITFGSKFKGDNVETTSQMFRSRRGLTSLDMSNFNTPKLKNCSDMFYDCRGLSFLDIRNMTFDSVTSSSNMFNSTMPNSCLIIVKSDTEKEWITSKFTFLTNVKTVAEYEGS